MSALVAVCPPPPRPPPPFSPVPSRAGTEFCGYAIPHPSEPYVHLRLQTDGSVTAREQLRKGLAELAKSTAHFDTALSAAFADFDGQMES